MNNIVLNKYDEIVMKLLHYFITEQGYNPVILHGAKDEIWLENLDKDYKIVRIVTNYIHNDEQMEFDIYRTKQIMKNIKKKTFSFGINGISFFLNLGDNVHFSKFTDVTNLVCLDVNELDDIKKSKPVVESFPNILENSNFKEKGMELFMKITGDINKKNEEEAKKAENIFKQKKPVITYSLIIINIILFALMYIMGDGSNNIETLLKFGATHKQLIINGDYYRLITSAFLHIGVLHLLMNMYALYIIGPQIESFLGKSKYLIVYLFSAIAGGLMSMVLATPGSVGAGASGAIFGLLGSLLYFGYHYRTYLGNVLKSQIIPLIILNLLLGFLPGIGGWAHIGGLVGGILMTMALGLKYKTGNYERMNGAILTIIFTSFLIYLGFII